MRLEDIVRITVKHPVGADKIRTLNFIGMINGIENFENSSVYHVLTKHGEYAFVENELEFATRTEIKQELKRMIREYYIP